jgi:hypothetical protein
MAETELEPRESSQEIIDELVAEQGYEQVRRMIVTMYAQNIMPQLLQRMEQPARLELAAKCDLAYTEASLLDGDSRQECFEKVLRQMSAEAVLKLQDEEAPEYKRWEDVLCQNYLFYQDQLQQLVCRYYKFLQGVE